MLEYQKLIRHPISPTKREYLKLSKRGTSTFSVYTAEVIDGVLAVTVYKCNRYDRNVTAEFRHFYNHENYATEEIATKTKRRKNIRSCLEGNWWYLRSWYAAEDADQVIMDYLGSGGGMRDLINAENGIDIEKAEQRDRKIADVINARMRCVAEDPPPEFWDWANKQLPRYFFYHKVEGKEQSGFCSHCRHSFSSDSIRQYRTTVCPSCGSELKCLTVESVGNYEISNDAKVTYIHPTVEDGKNILVERTWYIWQDINGVSLGVEEMRVRLDTVETDRAFYNADDLTMCGGGRWGECGYIKKNRWTAYCERGAKPCSSHAWIYPHNIDTVLRATNTSIKNVEASVIVPQIKTDFLSLINALEKRPSVEGLVKAGCCKLAKAVYGTLFDGRHGELNRIIRAKCASPSEALCISRDELKLLGDASEKDFLLFFYLCKLHNAKFETYLKYRKLKLQSKREDINELFIQHPAIGMVKLANYLEKQAKLQGQKMVDKLFGIYLDYLRMAKDLRLPQTESVLFPKDIQQEHDRLVKIDSDRTYGKQNKLLKKRVKILEILDFSDGEFLIRPLRSADEFLKESSVLNHCVKGYIDECAAGRTNIYGIRKVADPETPYFTLTLSNQAIVTMNLGKNNCQPPKEIKEFVDKWKKKVISKKKQEFIEAANPQQNRQKARITA